MALGLWREHIRRGVWCSGENRAFRRRLGFSSWSCHLLLILLVVAFLLGVIGIWPMWWKGWQYSLICPGQYYFMPAILASCLVTHLSWISFSIEKIYGTPIYEGLFLDPRKNSQVKAFLYRLHICRTLKIQASCRPGLNAGLLSYQLCGHETWHSQSHWSTEWGHGVVLRIPQFICMQSLKLSTCFINTFPPTHAPAWPQGRQIPYHYLEQLSTKTKQKPAQEVSKTKTSTRVMI